MKTLQDFSPYNRLQWTQMFQGLNDSFSAASKRFNRYQTMNKGLI